jgi:hypothetical protein
MFCPQCRAEYREGYFECADCHVGLVTVLEEPTAPPGEDTATVKEELVQVFRTSSPFEANLVKGLLESAGIEVFDVDANISRMSYNMGMTVGIKLAVRQSECEAANEILRETRGKSGQDPNFGTPVPFLFGITETDDEKASPAPPSNPPTFSQCAQCGASTLPDSNFCDQCGARL